MFFKFTTNKMGFILRAELLRDGTYWEYDRVDERPV